MLIHPIVEESDEGKLSRPVMQTIETIIEGKPGDEFNAPEKSNSRHSAG